MAQSARPLRVVILTAEAFEDLKGLLSDVPAAGGGGDRGDRRAHAGSDPRRASYGLKPSKTFEQVDPEAYDLLVVPGGFPDGAPHTVRQHPRALEITRAFFAKDKPVASICHGPWTLADAGVVRGRRVTSYWHDSVPEDLKGAGATYEDASVVVDGNLVTSRWPPDLPDFMREVMAKLGPARP